MRKSRLNLFKSTSMLISIVGIISIIFLIVLVGFSGYSIVNKSITDQISSGNQYDDLAQLKTTLLNQLFILVVQMMFKNIMMLD